MKNVLATTETIKNVLKNWIDEADHDTIEMIYNQNFDNEIVYDPEVGLFEVPVDEAKRVGIDELCNQRCV